MSCCDELVIPEEVQREERREEFARETHTWKTRTALVVVAKALRAKNKGSGPSESLVETGKDVDKNQTVDALVEALVETGKEEAAAVDKNQTERSFIDRLFDEYEFITDDFFEDDPGEVDEELAKQFTEVQESCRQMWRDCVNKALKAGVQFADPSHPHCLIACD